MRTSRFAVVLLLAACHGNGSTVSPEPVAPQPAQPVAPPPAISTPIAPVGTPVSLASVGLEPDSLDRSADPCNDFYQFACGGWLAHNEIPADRARWGRISQIDEQNKLVIRTLLDDDAKSPADPGAKKLGDYYASCMDESTIDQHGMKAIAPLLAKTTHVHDAASWFAAVIALHKIGSSVVFGAYAAADEKDSLNNVIYLDTAGLGLPDRDYYSKPELADKLAAYRAHVGRMLVLGGTPAAKSAAAADDVVAIETAIAALTKTGVERRDVEAAYNPTDAAGLAAKAKSIDWKAYWKALNITPSTKLVLGTPKFFDALDGLRSQFKPAQWASYFTYHLLADQAFSLGTKLDDEQFELQKALTGVTAKPDRFKRCIDATTGGLGEVLGQQYAAKYFPDASKQAAVALVDAIVHTMGENIAGLDWMSDPSKQIAAGKLAKVVRMIGFPDTWRTYDYAVARDDFAGNELRASEFETHRVLARAGKPVDRAEWLMNTFTVNAYYNPPANNTALPAGILQPPFFGAHRGVAVNLGGIGMVIGHELTHGFDDQGAKYDADGNLHNWWQPSDKQKFEAKGTCVADQYSKFEPLPGQHVNGKLTLGENIADMGGVKTAFRAYRKLRAGATPLVADGFTEDQQFFLAVGQAWCSKDRPAEIQRRITVDPHSPPKFRVTGALSNLPEFSAAFRCAPGTTMHPANSCSVW